MLDVHQPQGRAIFLKPAATADLVIEDGAPGALENAHAGYNVLSSLRPQLVLTSITPFGQSGPYAYHAARAAAG
jgi:crotonobetainyl-CoA:carnitine CoA-transferase CaiB-like acyl-CoA transferase